MIEAYWSPRYGAIEHTPNSGIYGPKVMIANESAGSGGDALPWLFKHNHLGTLVGKRTWGGLVGIGPIPVLMDGGEVTSPSVAFFSPAGEWDVENHGVEPDVTVEQDPKAVAEGHDPQLEKAVAVALEQLKQNPPPEPHRPAYPNYHRRSRGRASGALATGHAGGRRLLACPVVPAVRGLRVHVRRSFPRPVVGFAGLRRGRAADGGAAAAACSARTSTR